MDLINEALEFEQQKLRSLSISALDFEIRTHNSYKK